YCLDVAQHCGADAEHPVYGLLSENDDCAAAVEEAGMTFIGPSPALIRQLGHKTEAGELMREHGMPMTRSSAVLSDLEAVHRAVGELGYPLLIKRAGGGGGIGRLPIRGPQGVETAWKPASELADRCFAQPELYLEQLIEAPRHIEFQFLADRHGGVRCIFERDCSTQRRHQKVLEEAPAPGLNRAEVDAMAARLEGILAALKYDVIGTVEMLYTPDAGFVFLEVNTRLQVEH